MNTAKYKNKYRIESSRLKYWDYSSRGIYFITICTKNKQHFFGYIKNGIMQKNELGRIVEKQWLKTPSIRKNMKISLGSFAVMPNHFHAIIAIDNIIIKNQTPLTTTIPRRDALSASLKNASPLLASQKQPNKSHHIIKVRDEHRVSTFGPQSNNISSIIRGFKSSISSQARKLRPDFGWQQLFYDHIIRDEKSLEIISNYISLNSLLW